MSKELKCPSCGNSDEMSTIESLVGLAECDSIEQGGPDWNGTTNVIYEESETIGVHCDCGWEYEGVDWMNQLVA
jgi:hypothetical protein